MSVPPEATPTLPLRTGRWVADPAHSAVVFSIRHLGLTRVWGRFDRFDAALDVGTSLETTRVEATIDTASVNTNHSERDAHLRSTDFFAIERHPTMRFESTRISGAGADWQMDGELTVNGIPRAVSLEVEFHGLETHQDGSRHTGFSASGELRRSDFGIEFGILPIGVDKLAIADKVRVELDLQFVEPGDPPQ